MDKRIRLLDRLRIQLQGHIYAGNQKKRGWIEPLPFYIFKCPVHGYVNNYAIGYEGKLTCPLCVKEKQGSNDPVYNKSDVMQIVEEAHYSNE